jgi:hypothetical protein
MVAESKPNEWKYYEQSKVNRTFRNKKRIYLKGEVNELETNSKNKKYVEHVLNVRRTTNLELKWEKMLMVIFCSCPEYFEYFERDQRMPG